ncbi:hypothetical protein [Caproicibacterium sp. BJN0003]|uniref:hypothetical protein n=1 Tax=Caproicibacterium sp. BJN0003 TaxID=2994078 RepID=UPI0022519636|nr:hypothetical protein [Caproicibacterium sp. BJN0003]UZT81262.1 hypothetical protein OP489_07010 [Caproicibacterium sp. BJN0003]
MAERKRFKMGTPRDIKRTLNRVSNMVLNGQIDSKDANAIIYACNTTLSTIRIDEQEKRLDELEKVIKNMEESK